jgi:SAM-dependent methyltransferase
MRKRYDREYFERWYRGPDQAVGSAAALRRNVHLAVAVTESVLARPLRSVLDVGCGEGRWQPVLHRLRPKASYLGIDSSEYAVERYGRRRNLRLGNFEEIDLHVFDRPFDLVVCSDVLHYLTPDQIRLGLPTLAEITGGAALLEVFTSADAIEGDDFQFFRRPPTWYRKTFREAGFRPLGLQMWVPGEVAGDLDAMDLPA